MLLNEVWADAYFGTEEPVVDVSAIPGMLSLLTEGLFAPFELQTTPSGDLGAWSVCVTTVPPILPVFDVVSSTA